MIANNGVVALKDQPEIARSYSGQKYKTTSGKIDLYYENMVKHGQALPQWEAPNEAYAGNPLADKYPINLTQRRSKYFIHQNFIIINLFTMDNSCYTNKLRFRYLF